MADEFRFRAGWQWDAFKTLECGALVAETCEKIRLQSIKDAPRHRSAKSSWNMIKKNISAYVERDAKGYYGNVIIENNDRARHAMLQERGWTDKAGRKHPGLRYLKEALLKSREE